MTTPMSYFVLVCYRPHPGQETAVLDLVREHLPILRAEGLATAEPAEVWRATDGSLLEGFEWVSTAAAQSAHGNPAVQALWGRFAQVCSYRPLAELTEAQGLFAHFERVAL